MRDFIKSIKMAIYQIQTNKDPTDFIFLKISQDLNRSEEDICLFILCYCALKACYKVVCSSGGF